MNGTPDHVFRLEVSDAYKRYGDTVALNHLSLTAHTGEITGIAGPNGAGKSTLVKALAGEIVLDSGTIRYGPSEAAADSDPRTVKTAVVHQETSLFPNLTVAENLAISRPELGYGVPKTTATDRATMESLGIQSHSARKVIDCSLVVRQLTEIARAFVLDNADVLLLDEPNSALTVEESSLLFERVLDIKRDNRIVLLVSHRLEDLVTYCDRVLIVRDGRVTEELSGSDLSEAAIARGLVVDTEHAEQNPHARDIAAGGSLSSSRLEVSNWQHPQGKFRDANFVCRAGEVTAIVGNEGSGARELLRSLAGFETASGECELRDGVHSAPSFSSQYMPAERQVSLFTNLDCGQNVIMRLGIPDIATRGGWLRRRDMRVTAQELLGRFRVRGGGASTKIRALSGGNQQKVAIAAAVASEPSVLLLEEPTRGVDISSKAEIHRLLTHYAHQGRVVVTFCSELPEVFELADEVLVVAEGRVVAAHRVSEYSTVQDLAHSLAESAAAHRSAVMGRG